MALIAGTPSANPKFKCSTCDLEFQGTTRAAIHLHAREPCGSVRQCPNITDDQAKKAKRLYEKKKARPKKMPAAESGCGGGGPSPAKRFITAAVKPMADIIFTRFVFMCSLPF